MYGHADVLLFTINPESISKAPCTMDLSCIVDVGDYTLAIFVMRFAFHSDDFDLVSDFYLSHVNLLMLILSLFCICNKNFLSTHRF